MQCERCGMQLDTGDAKALSMQCSRCGHVNTNDTGQPVFVLDPDDSDIFSLDDKTRVDSPAVGQEQVLGRVATTKKKQPSLGDMLFLDAEPSPTVNLRIGSFRRARSSRLSVEAPPARKSLEASLAPMAPPLFFAGSVSKRSYAELIPLRPPL